MTKKHITVIMFVTCTVKVMSSQSKSTLLHNLKKKILNGLHVAKFSLSKYKLMIFPFWLVLQQCPNSIRGYKRWEWEEEKQVEWERYTSMSHYSHLLYVNVSLSICVGLSTSQGIFHIFPGKKETNIISLFMQYNHQ